MFSGDSVPPEQLRSFGCKALTAAGLIPGSAALVTDVLVEADLAGHPSHGVVRLPVYVDRLLAGGMNALSAPAVVEDRAGTALVDGRNGPGPVTAVAAMQLAINKARRGGIGAVAVRNSGHLGRLAYYASQALTAEMVGLCLSNASPRLAPAGGMEPILGNNPWALAVPAGAEPPIVVDMANSIAAAGKIRQFLAEERSIPEGWALDACGHPTVDPAAALAGVLLPMAGHKGYAIALAVELLTGVLAGGLYGPSVRPVDQLAQPQHTSHLLIAIDPAAFGDAARFKERVDAYIRETKSSRKAAGAAEILLPGERSHRTRAIRLAEGIPLGERTAQLLNQLATRLNLNEEE